MSVESLPFTAVMVFVPAFRNIGVLFLVALSCVKGVLFMETFSRYDPLLNRLINGWVKPVLGFRAQLGVTVA